MDYNEFLQTNQTLIYACVVAAPALLYMLSCCCCYRTNERTYEDKEVAAINVDERNSRLAFMLMLLLTENKKENRKYIRMAESIGYDHIIHPSDLYPSDSEYDSDSGGDKTE
jgi:hypothetical protein